MIYCNVNVNDDDRVKMSIMIKIIYISIFSCHEIVAVVDDNSIL